MNTHTRNAVFSAFAAAVGAGGMAVAGGGFTTASYKAAGLIVVGVLSRSALQAAKDIGYSSAVADVAAAAPVAIDPATFITNIHNAEAQAKDALLSLEEAAGLVPDTVRTAVVAGPGGVTAPVVDTSPSGPPA